MTVTPIRVHVGAPPRPAYGADCNGCGACCVAAPCPLSYLLLRHRSGSCPALRWHDDARRYQCGLLVAPREYVRWLPARGEALARRAVLRWIAAGTGCDFAATAVDESPQNIKVPPA